MTKRTYTFLQLLTLCGLAAGLAFAPLVQGAENVRITQVDTTKFPQVTFFVSITDANGQPLAVDPNRLIVMENGEQIPPDQIQGIGEVGAISTLLVIDVSDSMNSANKLDAAKAAADEFINRMRPEDQVGIIAFDTVVDNVQDFTSDQETLHAAIASLTAQRNTAMYDALTKAIDQLKGIDGRKAIILLSDGLDNSSSANRDAVISQIGGAEGFSISAVGFGEPGQSAFDAGIDEPALQDLAGRAGGLYAYAQDEDALTRLFGSYAVGLQSEYQITYTSPAALRDGVNRSLSVTLSPIGGGAQPATSAGNENSRYNPGGLVPEVAQPASWPWFGAVVIGLAALVLIPMFFTNWRSSRGTGQAVGSNGRTSSAGRGKVKVKSKARPRIKLR